MEIGIFINGKLIRTGKSDEWGAVTIRVEHLPLPEMRGEPMRFKAQVKGVSVHAMSEPFQIGETRKEARERMRVEEEKRKSEELRKNGGYIDQGDSTVLNPRLRLVWANLDNGHDINWHDAKKYCESFRGGGHADWRMPTMAELSTLYDQLLTNSRYDHMTSLITLSSSWVWSATLDESGSEAAILIFNDGRRDWFPPVPLQQRTRLAGAWRQMNMGHWVI